MKKIGKLVEYDGNIGTIIDQTGDNHIVIKKDMTHNNIKQNDFVIFESEIYKTSTNDHNIARFVKKLSLTKEEK